MAKNQHIGNLEKSRKNENPRIYEIIYFTKDLENQSILRNLTLASKK